MAIEPPGINDNDSVTYFEQPVLKRPGWGWSVVTYLFLGGIMGASSMLAAMVDRTASESENKLVRNANVASLALALACPAVLISHLGRPERFLNMLRIFKLKSPMSMGVWGLVFFSGVATAAAAREFALIGILPKWMRHIAPPGAPLLQALLGSFIAGYTGVLLSATAIPIWAKGKRHIPAVSVASGIGSACALQSLLLLRGENRAALEKLERFELAAAAAEILILFDFERYAGEYGAPMFAGVRGAQFRTVTIRFGMGVPLAINALALIFKPRGTFAKLLRAGAAALTLAGGYMLRQTLIESGKDSADDPRAGFAQPE
ncbi:MAG: polysulfide reductase NrfD [Candidatus Eremiobacteraeota bacterium]|nr:polysulfide reductase NrfD [Candidatus Eremiobacteraeota bacterium]